jgi:hypothetical protein
VQGTTLSGNSATRNLLADRRLSVRPFDSSQKLPHNIQTERARTKLLAFSAALPLCGYVVFFDVMTSRKCSPRRLRIWPATTGS